MNMGRFVKLTYWKTDVPIIVNLDYVATMMTDEDQTILLMSDSSKIVVKEPVERITMGYDYHIGADTRDAGLAP